jgi:hypothetical protein
VSAGRPGRWIVQNVLSPAAIDGLAAQ